MSRKRAEENVILIIDSDEETESIPTTSLSNPTLDVTAISIDLTEDDTPLSYNSPKRSQNTSSNSKTLLIPPTTKKPVSSPISEIPNSKHLNSIPLSTTSIKPIVGIEEDASKKSSPFPTHQESRSPNVNSIKTTATNKKDIPRKSISVPGRQQPKSPNTTATLRKVVSVQENSLPLTDDINTLLLPQGWNSPSSLERRTSQALLAKRVSSTPPGKLSVPRSALLKNSTPTIKRNSSILKASSSPIRKTHLSPSISATLKRPIESPERPTHSTSTFTSPNRTSLENNNKSPSLSAPNSPGERLPQNKFNRDKSPKREPLEPLGSPKRKSAQNFEAFESPERRSINRQSELFDSPDRDPLQLFEAFSSSERVSPTSNLVTGVRRAKMSSSPFSKPPVKVSSRRIYELEDDDDELGDDLESFISVIDSSRRKVVVNNTPKNNVFSQCPLCYLMFPKNDLIDHASDCTGERVEEDEDDSIPKIGQKRGIRKNTIAAAVILNENERKRLNKGKIDMGPTNYYTDSESILATDGTGLNAEVTGMSWESSGSVRFS